MVCVMRLGHGTCELKVSCCISQLWYVHLNHLCFLGTMMVSFMVSYVYTWMISSGWALGVFQKVIDVFRREFCIGSTASSSFK